MRRVRQQRRFPNARSLGQRRVPQWRGVICLALRELAGARRVEAEGEADTHPEAAVVAAEGRKARDDMNRSFTTIALASMLLVALATVGCTSWLKENAQNAADEAKQAAQCAKDNAPPDSPEVIFATAKAKDAEKFAQKAADAGKDAQKARDDANAKVKAAQDELAQAQADYQQAQKDLPAKDDYEEAKKRQGAAQQYVAFRNTKAEAETEAGGAKAIETLLAKSKLKMPMTEDEIATLDKWYKANTGFETLGQTFAADERDNPDALLSNTTAKLSDMDSKIKDAETKRLAVEEKTKNLNKVKATADLLTDPSVEANRVEAAAAAADKAADEAAHFAAKIPKCRDLAHHLRPDTFDPLAGIRPHGADLFGAQGPRKAPSGPGGGGHPSGGGGGGGGGGPEGP